MKKTLKQLANWLQAKGHLIGEQIVTGVAIDSRSVKKGDLFIPFRGEQVNGHRYVRKAFERGAIATLWLIDEPNPPKDVPVLFVEDAELALQQLARSYRAELTCTVIGVTGSNGKTSTKDLITSVLSPYASVQKTEGNFNNELGLPLTILSLDEEVEYAVLEMGMSGFGEIAFLSELAKPHIAVITNIGEAHMEALGSRQGIAQAKFEIVTGLAKDGLLILDADEPLLTALTDDLTQTVCFVGTNEQATEQLDYVQTTEEGSQFSVKGTLDETYTIPVYGTHQAKNAVMALVVGQAVGLTKEQMQQSLKRAQLTPMRMQPIVKNGTLFINDAYNAAPSSVQAALTFIQNTTLRSKKIIVLGDMLELGEQEQTYHEELATAVTKVQPMGVLLFGNRMKWLAAQLPQEKVCWTTDMKQAHQWLQQVVDEETVVLIKGSRGMALERLLEN